MNILIGIMAYGDVDPKILENYMAFSFHCGRRMQEHKFHIVVISKMEQDRGRNRIIEYALGHPEPIDYIFMLDDDHVLDVSTGDFSILQKLLDHNKDIVGALYWQRGPECKPVIMHEYRVDGEPRWSFYKPEEVKGCLQEVGVIGPGALLVKTDVLRNMENPYWYFNGFVGIDLDFCYKARQAGYRIYCDTSLEVGHVLKERPVIWSGNRETYMALAPLSEEELARNNQERAGGIVYEPDRLGIFRRILRWISGGIS